MYIGFEPACATGTSSIDPTGRARYLIPGSRIPGDGCYYPDDDLMWVDRGDGSISGA